MAPSDADCRPDVVLLDPHHRGRSGAAFSSLAIAIIVAVGVMLFAAKPINNFVDAHPPSRAGFVVSYPFDNGDRRRFRRPCPEGIHLLCMAFSVAEMLNRHLPKSSNRNARV